MTLQQFKYLIFLFFLPVSFSAQTIGKFSVKGNKIFKTGDYLNWIKIQNIKNIKNQKSLHDTIANRISKKLAEEGFYNFKIDSISIDSPADSGKINITLIINEGKPTLIKSTSIQNPLPEKDSLKIMPVLRSLHGQIFSKQIIENSISRIINYFENSGFPFATVKIHSVNFSSGPPGNEHYAGIVFLIKKNQLGKIDKIQIEGNTKTKAGVIIRTAGIKPGELYSESKIAGIPQRLNRLRFFEKVGKPEFYFNSKGKGILLIKVKEKQTNFFDGILGYVPPSGTNGKGYFTGFANVKLGNLFGTGRVFAFKWLQENRYSQELELNYLEPWVLDYPVNFKTRLYQRKQDTTYIKRKIGGNIEYLTTEEISASVFIVSESTIPVLGNNNKFTVFNSNSISTGIELKIDTRDNPLAPKSGLLFVNSYSYSSKKINGPEQFLTPQTQTVTGLQRLQLDFSFYYELFTNQVVQLSVHGKELRGNSLEVSDLYKFGGTNSMRGYREKQFSANRLLWSNLEYRYLISEFSYAFLFFDAGYYLRNKDEQTNTPEVSDVLKSFGLGFSLESALGILNISYAVPQGAPVSKGLIHFGILNNF